jgi:hypothetical protein
VIPSNDYKSLQGSAIVRYMVEYGMKVPVSKPCPSVKVVNDDAEAIFDFEGDTGYTGQSNLKAIVPAENIDSARRVADKFLTPIIEKIMMVNRVKVLISPLHFVLEGSQGTILRKCFVSRLWRKGVRFDSSHFSQQTIDNIMNTNFAHFDNNAIAYFRLALLSSNQIDAFRNFRLSLESLVKSKRRIRKCGNAKCRAELYCKACGEPSMFETVLDDDIKAFWKANMMDLSVDAVDKVLEMRQITFHSVPLQIVYSEKLAETNHLMEIALGFYFTAGSQFVPMPADYGRNYYSKETFDTNFPDQEFPSDFPKEVYWRDRIHHLEND